jgi:hypothetical protein
MVGFEPNEKEEMELDKMMGKNEYLNIKIKINKKEDKLK